MHRRKFVIASRTMLLMLVVAAVAVLCLGAASLLLGDPPEVSGWLRTVFGAVFGVVAIMLAGVLGVPSGVGLWAMAGASAVDAIPALPPRPRMTVTAVAIVVVVLTAVVLAITGSSIAILNLGLLGLVALFSLGLAGAASFSPHRGRAIASAIALVAVAVGTLWVLANAFIWTPR